jgi:hypothetical protein
MGSSMKNNFHEGETVSRRTGVAELAAVCIRPVSGSQILAGSIQQIKITVAGAASGLSNNKINAPNFPFNLS